MQYTKTLYKTDTKGKVRFITVSAIDGELIQESGLVDGINFYLGLEPWYLFILCI